MKERESMGKFKKFDIVLNKQVVMSGEKLTGSIVLQVQERVQINQIKLRCLGVGRVHW
jgi:hypothetical protein